MKRMLPAIRSSSAKQACRFSTGSPAAFRNRPIRTVGHVDEDLYGGAARRSGGRRLLPPLPPLPLLPPDA